MFRTLKDVEEAPLSNYCDVPPPPKKCQKESEPQKKRVFSEKWLQEVSWLQTNDERTEMWCRMCRENLINDKLKRHEHFFCIEKISNRDTKVSNRTEP